MICLIVNYVRRPPLVNEFIRKYTSVMSLCGNIIGKQYEGYLGRDT